MGRWLHFADRARSIALAVAIALPGGGRISAQVAEDLRGRPARLDIANGSIADALRELQRTSGVALAFSPDLLPIDRRVSCACAERTVGEALETILRGTGLVHEVARRQILIGRRQPERTGLAGLVVDGEVGYPVTAAEVRVAGGGARALTGDDGRFLLRGLHGAAHELVISSLGYEDRTVSVAAGEESVRVELTRRPIPLAEIVIAPGRVGVLEVGRTLSGSAVSREDIEAIPQFGDDVFRTLKRMPGVFAEDISTKLNVRGGSDRDLLVRLDGLELYEPYHLKDLDGALGIIDVQSLGGVDLVTGGFPAEYGDKTAGVFNMYSRGAPSTGTRTTLGMSLSSLSAISQGGFADQRGQWLVSLRRGFLEYVLAVAGVEDEMDPRYWDVLARVQYLFGENHLVWGEILHAGDDLDWFDDATRSAVSSSWADSYGWLGWRATFGGRLRAETMLSVGQLTRDRIGDVDNPNGGAFTPLTADVSDVATFDFAGAKQDWQLDLTEDLMLKAGGEVRTMEGAYDYASVATRFEVDDANQLYVRADSNEVEVDPSGLETGGYLSLRGRNGPLTWEVGARHDWQEHTGDVDVAPRALLRVDLGDRTNLKATYGRYSQSHGLHELSTKDGERDFAPSEMAEQVALGVEHDFGNGYNVRLEGYRRGIDDPRPSYVNLAREVNPVMEVESDRHRIDPTEGRAKGLELIVSRDGTGAFSWSGSFALARAEDFVDGAWAPRTLDQRHTVNLRGAVGIGRSWQISGAWSFHTGWPYTEQFLDLEIGLNEDGTEMVDILRRGFGPYNAERLPSYHRADLRITRSFELRGSRLELFFDVFNLYDRTNLRGYDFHLEGRNGVYHTVRDSGEEQLPILPTIGFRWVF